MVGGRTEVEDVSRGREVSLAPSLFSLVSGHLRSAAVLCRVPPMMSPLTMGRVKAEPHGCGPKLLLITVSM